MKFEIPEAIIKEAGKCTKNHQCVDGMSQNPLCEIQHYIKDKLVFIECKEDKICPYFISFGKTKLCECPVRKEIYERHKV